MDLHLRDWAEGDLELLVATMGAAAATRYLGGPEPPEKLARRHERYLALAATGRGRMFVAELDGQAVASVGYWDAEWEGAPVYETGWTVRPEHWGRGVASRATIVAMERARQEGRHRWVHAFPSVENAASNAVCRKVGFTLLGEVEVEYPPGRLMRANDWRLDLGATAPGPRRPPSSPPPAPR
jgi:RimJ/RimL family protein N-acetyltransferase